MRDHAERIAMNIHKPRGQLKGGGVSQMTILLHKPYLINVKKKEGKKYPKI